MEKFNVIICGSRNFNDYKKLKEFCDKILSTKRLSHKIVIISGAAKGADALGELYAKEKGFECLCFSAEWDKYGKSAGIRRNEEMLKQTDGVIAFSVNYSRGTEHMIKIAKAGRKKVAVMRL